MRPRRVPIERIVEDEVPLALAPLQRAAPDAHPRGAPKLAWPIDGGTVSSQYGTRGRRHHDGIDISVHYGAPVYAAAQGEVVYAGSLRGYGRMIIIQHAHGFVTVYAHNARQDVETGHRVKRGELIAHVGRTGRTTGVNLHFEVRKDNVAYDPLAFLPPRPEPMAREE
jgi:murein DD-endopeptidase MepM/ murein hydrolase activator NlpD